MFYCFVTIVYVKGATVAIEAKGATIATAATPIPTVVSVVLVTGVGSSPS